MAQWMLLVRSMWMIGQYGEVLMIGRPCQTAAQMAGRNYYWLRLGF